MRPSRRSRPSGPTRGRILAIDESGPGAVVAVASGPGLTRQVVLPTRPDPVAAAELLRTYLRASWVLFDLGPGPSAIVGIRGNRVPGRLRVSAGTALGLAARGVPAYLAGGGA